MFTFRVGSSPKILPDTNALAYFVAAVTKKKKDLHLFDQIVRRFFVRVRRFLSRKFTALSDGVVDGLHPVRRTSAGRCFNLGVGVIKLFSSSLSEWLNKLVYVPVFFQVSWVRP
jgi:hypothetical protein